jgi:hypothetical protein
MSNRLLTTSEITNEALMVLSNQLGFTSKVSREYDDRFARSGAKIGNTINVRKPIKLRPSSGQAIDIQAANEQYVPVVLNKQYQRAFAFSSAERTLSLDLFSERILKPAMISMANEVDGDGMTYAKNVSFNQVGTPGSLYNSRDTFNTLVGDAKVTMNRFLAPPKPRFMAASSQFSTDGATYNNQIFNPQGAIADQYSDNVLVRALGFDWMETELAPTHTNGTYSGSGAVASVSGGTLVTDTWGGSTFFTKGTVFTIAGVTTVNGQTKQNTGVLQKFVVTADTTAGATQTLSIFPAPVGPEDAQNQNVNRLPVDGDLITVIGASEATYQTSLAFAKEAFTFACADLDVPKGVNSAGRASDGELGLSIRYVEDYDIRSDQYVIRLDLLGGWNHLYNELATRLVTR